MIKRPTDKPGTLVGMTALHIEPRCKRYIELATGR